MADRLHTHKPRFGIRQRKADETTSSACRESLEAMVSIFDATPELLHHIGPEAKAEIERARAALAKAEGADT